MCNGPEGARQAQFIESVALSRRTITRRISDLAAYIGHELKKIIDDCKYYSIAIDGSTDIGHIEQVMIFLKTINGTFEL